MFNIVIALGLVFIGFSAQAKNCSLNYNQNDVQITWTAYKTPKKVGVPGSFNKIHVAGPSTGNSVVEILSQSSFSIDLLSLDTKNPTRDKTISTSFFRPLKEYSTAKGFFKNISKSKLDMVLNLNGKTKTVPMKLELSGNTLKATGKIDVLDFAMSGSLAHLHRACKDLHQGKTWSEVSLQFTAPFHEKCQ